MTDVLTNSFNKLKDKCTFEEKQIKSISQLLQHCSLCTARGSSPPIRKHLLSPPSLLLRGWSRPWARSGAGLGAGLGAGRWALLSGLGSALILLWRRGAGGRFGCMLFFSILYWGGWATARLLVDRPLLRSATRIPLRLHLRTALWTRLGLAVGWTGPRFARDWTRFGFLGSRTRPASARTWFAFSWLGARLPPRPGAGMIAPLFAVGTRPAGTEVKLRTATSCIERKKKIANEFRIKQII